VGIDSVQMECTIGIDMNVINATVLRNNLSDAMAKVKNEKDYVLIAKRGKVTSALVDIDFFEDLLALGNDEYLRSIKQARSEYESGDVFGHDEVFGEI